jgi:hypothetical protein
MGGWAPFWQLLSLQLCTRTFGFTHMYLQDFGLSRASLPAREDEHLPQRGKQQVVLNGPLVHLVDNHVAFYGHARDNAKSELERKVNATHRGWVQAGLMMLKVRYFKSTLKYAALL